MQRIYSKIHETYFLVDLDLPGDMKELNSMMKGIHTAAFGTDEEQKDQK